MITILIILTLITILDAFGDAMRLKGKQVIHHQSEAVMYLLFGIIIYMVNFNPVSSNEFIWLAVYFVSFRVFAFDVLFNLFAGLKWHYIGDSNLWDRMMKKSYHFVKIGALFFIVISLIEIL